MVGLLVLDLRDELRVLRAVVAAAVAAEVALSAVGLLLVVAPVAPKVRQSSVKMLEKSIVVSGWCQEQGVTQMSVLYAGVHPRGLWLHLYMPLGVSSFSTS